MTPITPITAITPSTPMTGMNSSEAFVQQPVAGGVMSNFCGVDSANGDASPIRVKAH